MRSAGRAVAALALLGVLATSGCGDGDDARAAATTPSAENLARAATDRFLDRYLAADGRVVRRDQGGDTVSEGQAYAMLLTAAAGDGVRFDRVWKWTRAHLQRPDGLLSWRYGDGRVADPQPATDADLDAAQALVLAGQRFSRSDLRAAGARIAAAVLDHETATGDDGGRLLVAGPWAVAGRIVNPSYFSPRAYTALAATGRAAEWAQLAQQALAPAATALPPDWASATTATLARPLAGPALASAGPPRYGFDAVRVAIRMGAACDAPSRAVAGRLWPALSGSDAGLLPRRLDGPPAGGATRNAVALVGAAGAARGAGRPADVTRLLDAASKQDSATPSYYGAAWVALGRVLLTTDLAGRCPSS
ncbi:MAG TPA: glycosyl hydrolase family 8 [Solirubrobacteraceae bacterium]